MEDKAKSFVRFLPSKIFEILLIFISLVFELIIAPKISQKITIMKKS